MRAYVGTTGTVFALVAIAHLARTGEMLSKRANDPVEVTVFTALTVLAVALAVWAFRLFRTLPRGAPGA